MNRPCLFLRCRFIAGGHTRRFPSGLWFFPVLAVARGFVARASFGPSPLARLTNRGCATLLHVDAMREPTRERPLYASCRKNGATLRFQFPVSSSLWSTVNV